ncbi:fimbrial protein [Aggregatibacter actinomycetemcomitans]|uniref:Fimbrial protein n=1 Tax=Aggregatibacter actinomycetemcomitans TaxID=714 RepID=Q93GW7_AGGAC|nr:Flp family type IVb pilin [Aggregatibacter actinomycetemcomitans]AFI87210.1 fimbrial protein [Aggregatibacter actinomycetemcomitans D7S-1]AAL93276.1 flp-1 protein [Aggregatibacter actinomycetemcomitans]AAL93277.1 flp-1 protein [Aggregatibacter actinomycetemcomitans]AAL93279.1 flp-1 protein [Aggregatibacter actinomycetemcomitans]AAL93280.1 flp-1 protein [Aggregatibacter actinomycetemcomitans]
MLNTLTTKAYIKAIEAIRSFKKNQAGVTAIEYGLIAIAVAVLIVAVFYSEGGFIAKLQSKFNDLTSTISSASVKK